MCDLTMLGTPPILRASKSFATIQEIFFAMKTGFALPNIGPVATAEAVIKVAERAEALAYDSLWTIERLLWPLKPKTPYPVTPDGLLPEQYKYILDPLDTLTSPALSECSPHGRAG